MTATIHHGDSMKLLKERFKPRMFHAVVTDPPYGLTSMLERFGKPGSAEGRGGKNGKGMFKNTGKGFVGQDWDAEIPKAKLWRRMLHRSRPGAPLLAFGHTRTFWKLCYEIDKAGWEIHDTLFWLHGQGMPIGAGKGAPGYASRLKPMVEPIVLAYRPREGSYEHNFEKWGVAGLNIEGCTLTEGGPSKTVITGHKPDSPLSTKGRFRVQGAREREIEHRDGRWPTGVILDEQAGAQLDAMSPQASRFCYASKTISAERHSDVAGARIENHHPTVKPLDVMQWLVRLVKQPGETVICDPFFGSGTTGVAALREGVEVHGIERDENYVKIAEARIRRDSMMHECEVL